MWPEAGGGFTTGKQLFPSSGHMAVHSAQAKHSRIDVDFVRVVSWWLFAIWTPAKADWPGVR